MVGLGFLQYVCCVISLKNKLTDKFTNSMLFIVLYNCVLSFKILFSLALTSTVQYGPAWSHTMNIYSTVLHALYPVWFYWPCAFKYGRVQPNMVQYFISTQVTQKCCLWGKLPIWKQNTTIGRQNKLELISAKLSS